MNKKSVLAIAALALLIFSGTGQADGTSAAGAKATSPQNRESNAQAALKSKLKEVLIPSMKFNNAKLSDVIEYLKTRFKGVNIVFCGSQDAGAPTVTLELVNVPLYDVLRYVCEATNSQLRIDDHAVVIIRGRITPPNAYAVKTKVAPVKGKANQFTVAFEILEKQADGTFSAIVTGPNGTRYNEGWKSRSTAMNVAGSMLDEATIEERQRRWKAAILGM